MFESFTTSERPDKGQDMQDGIWKTAVARRDAVSRRDARADGRFVYAVRTTGVYCRPSCPSRHARPENMRFFADPQAAERAGFRACKRCTPDVEGLATRNANKIAQLCRLIERAAGPVPLKQLAAHAGLSPFHLQRMFRRATGLTPRGYAQALRAGRVRSALAESGSVTHAIYASGFESGGRFYSSSNARLGMTPTRFRAGGEDLTIQYAFGRSSLGKVLVAQTDKGICAIYLGDAEEALLEQLKQRFPRAELKSGGKAFAQVVRSVVAIVEEPALATELPLDIRGTAFQERVWSELRRIPVGTTTSYGEIAERMGLPSASRAVAQACGANQLAVIIPCHRVVRGSGALSGYRWGVKRKETLLAREKEKAR